MQISRGKYYYKIVSGGRAERVKALGPEDYDQYNNDRPGEEWELVATKSGENYWTHYKWLYETRMEAVNQAN